MAQSDTTLSSNPFLKQTAYTILNTWGVEGLRDAAIYFPSARAKLFFTQHISKILKSKGYIMPCWMPAWGNVSSLFEKIAEMRIVDPMMLIPTLHAIFLKHYSPLTDPNNGKNSAYHAALSDLNNFYYWGEVMLHDFSQIDLYLCDAQRLFVNIEALKQIDDAFDYLTEEQKQNLAKLFDFEERKQSLNRFFNVLKDENPKQNLKHQFISVWKILWPIYRDLQRFMQENKIGYSAHVARCAIERIKNQAIDDTLLQHLFPPRIAFAGFNALNKCEQILFDFIEKRYKLRQESALFLWNYSETMINDPLNEAGLFMRRHMADQRINASLSPAAPKANSKWELHAAPSTLAQVTILADMLAKQPDEHDTGFDTTTNSAIILADENLLLPLLRTLPNSIEHCNVTMGYPLRNTQTFSLLSCYLRLLASHDDTSLSYSKTALTDLLSHPYFAMIEGVTEFHASVAKTHGDKADKNILNKWHLSNVFFHPTGIANPIVSAQQLLATVANTINNDVTINTPSTINNTEQQLDTEHLLTAFSLLDTLRESLEKASYSYIADEKRGISPRNAANTLLLLLPKLFKNAKADFFGEPLEGLQIMGFLETRALDYDTVYILSANDDFLPRVANNPSFIPRSLQRAYGLPTRSDHEAMYAYYFDTITMRANRVVLIYSTGGEYNEPSRYILQRKYNPNAPELKEKKNGLPSPQVHSGLKISIEKTPQIQAMLARYLVNNNANNPKSLSPSSLNTYIDCPIKFYFSKIANITPPEENPQENFDVRAFGTCMHATLQQLYTPLLKRTLDKSILNALAAPNSVETAVRKAFETCIGYPPSHYPIDQLSLKWRIYLRATMRYVENILKTDIFRLAKIDSIVGLEYKIEGQVAFTDSLGNTQHVSIGGFIDRIDRLQGHLGFEVVDYKTGAFNEKYAIYVGNDKLAVQERDDHGYQLQILLYALLLNQQPEFSNCSITAGLWFPRCQEKKFMSPGLFNNKGEPFEITEYQKVLSDLPSIVGKVLTTLFDSSIPFNQCENRITCKYCDFRRLCNR